MSWAAARLEYAPGFDPITLPGPSDWEELGNLREANWKRGRQDSTAAMEPGSATFVVDDPEAAIFQAAVAGTIRPLTPVRCVVEYDGSDHVRFTGFMTDPPMPGGSGDSRYVTIDATDWLGWAASRELPASKWANWITALDPVVWLRSESVGTFAIDSDSRIVNLGSAGPDGDLYMAAFSTDTRQVGFSLYTGEETPIPGESGASWRSGWASVRGELQFAAAYVFMMWFKKDGAPMSATERLWTISDAPFSTTGERLRVSITTSGRFSIRVGGTGGTTTLTTPVGFDHCDDNWHLLVVEVAGSGAISVETDLTSTSGAVSGTALADGYLWCYGGEDDFYALDGMHYFSDIVLLDQPVFWENATQTANGFVEDTAGLWSTLIDGDLDTAGERAARYFEVAELAGPTVEDHTDPDLYSIIVYDDFGGSLADALIKIGAGRLGTTWVTVDGNLRIRDHGSLTDFDLAEFYQEHLAALTDYDFVATPPAKWGAFTWGDGTKWGPPALPTVRYEPSGTKPGRLDRIINEITLTDRQGYSITLRDDESRDRYGPRPRTFEMDGFLYDTRVQTSLLVGVRDLLAHFAEPPIEVGSVTVEPWGHEAATDLVLAAELERIVHYHESAPRSSTVLDGGDAEGSGPVEADGGDVDDAETSSLDGGSASSTGDLPPLVRGAFRIQSENWQWANGSHWSVTYTIEAA